MKKIFLTVAFAVAVASPALAASSHHARNTNADRGYAGNQSYAQAPTADFAQNGYVVADGKVLGRDPDAFIRQQLLRAGNINDGGSF